MLLSPQKRKKIILVTLVVMIALNTASFADGYTMTPNGNYVSGNSYTMAPDGSFVSGSQSTMTPNGTYVGN